MREERVGYKKNANTSTSPRPISGAAHAWPEIRPGNRANLDGSPLGALPYFIIVSPDHPAAGADKHAQPNRHRKRAKNPQCDRNKVYGCHCGAWREFSQPCLSHFQKIFD